MGNDDYYESIDDELEEALSNDDPESLSQVLVKIQNGNDPDNKFPEMIQEAFYDSIVRDKPEVTKKLLLEDPVKTAISTPHNFQLDSAVENAFDMGYTDLQIVLLTVPKIVEKYQSEFLESVDFGSTDNIAEALENYPEQILFATNHEGMNALQMAIWDKDLEIVELLLNDERFLAHLKDQDLYGRTALDLARHAGFDDAVNLISQKVDGNLEEYSNQIDAVLNIRQNYVIEKLTQYLELQGRDALNIMDQEGVCNGLAFLHQVYSTNGQQDMFFDMIGTIVKWDGSPETLETIPLPDSLQDKYQNFADLCEQMSNDITLFHFDTQAAKALGLDGWNQDARKQMYDLVRDPSEGRELRNVTHFGGDYNKAQMIEALELLRQYPGANIDIGGAGHATSLVIQDGKFSYYDPNVFSRVAGFESAEALAEHIIKYKYEGLDIANDDGTYNIEFRVNQFYPTDKPIPNQQLPQSPETIVPSLFSENQFNELHLAVILNDLNKIQTLIKQQPELISQQDALGNTPLHLALSNEVIQPQITDLIIDISQKEINLRNREGKTPLDLAVENNNVESVERLHKNPSCDVNLQDKYEKTALWKAADPKKLEVFKKLLSYEETEINHYNEFDVSIATILIQAQNLEGLKLLLEHPKCEIDLNRIDELGTSPLYYAVRSQNKEVINYLLEQGAKLDMNQSDGLFSIKDHAQSTPDILKMLNDHSEKQSAKKSLFVDSKHKQPPSSTTSNQRNTLVFSGMQAPKAPSSPKRQKFLLSNASKQHLTKQKPRETSAREEQPQETQTRRLKK